MDSFVEGISCRFDHKYDRYANSSDHPSNWAVLFSRLSVYLTNLNGLSSLLSLRIPWGSQGSAGPEGSQSFLQSLLRGKSVLGTPSGDLFLVLRKSHFPTLGFSLNKSFCFLKKRLAPPRGETTLAFFSEYLQILKGVAGALGVFSCVSVNAELIPSSDWEGRLQAQVLEKPRDSHNCLGTVLQQDYIFLFPMDWLLPTQPILLPWLSHLFTVLQGKSVVFV